MVRVTVGGLSKDITIERSTQVIGATAQTINLGSGYLQAMTSATTVNLSLNGTTALTSTGVLEYSSSNNTPFSIYALASDNLSATSLVRPAIVHLYDTNGRRTRAYISQPGIPTGDPLSISGISKRPNFETPAFILAFPYVGTFHRYNETGERLIRIPAAGTGVRLDYSNEPGRPNISGAWAAVVGEDNNGRDWITLDTKPSGAGANPWSTAGTAVNEANAAYQVTNGNYWVAGVASADGTTPIYFRVGLKSKLASATTDPRYGVIYLYYANNTRVYRMFVRQGEKADFVYMAADPITNAHEYLPTSRNSTYVRRISPYNLTTKGTFGTAMGTRGGKFTDFPTQGGALFQAPWSSTFLSYAWHPFSITSTPESTGLNSGTGIDWPWKEQYELCPTGYRHPAYSSVLNHDFSHSLYDRPDKTGWGEIAYAGGYYADGFFDRRLVVDHPIRPDGGGRLMVHAQDGYKSAYGGTLYYNGNKASANYLASIFFPWSMSRYDIEGEEMSVNTYYWTNAKNSSNQRPYVLFTHGINPYTLVFGTSDSQPRTSYVNVRCVQ